MTVSDFMEVLDRCRQEKKAKMVYVCSPFDDSVLFCGFNEGSECKYEKAYKMVKPAVNKSKGVSKEIIEVLRGESDFYGSFSISKGKNPVLIKSGGKGFGK